MIKQLHKFLVFIGTICIPVFMSYSGLLDKVNNKANKAVEAYSAVWNGFYGVGQMKNLLKAKLDSRSDGTPNIVFDTKNGSATFTIRLFVNDSKYNAWKEDAHRRFKSIGLSLDFSDFEDPGVRRIAGAKYRFGENEEAAIKRWEESGNRKQAELVVRMAIVNAKGEEMRIRHIPLHKFDRLGCASHPLPLDNLNRLKDLPPSTLKWIKESINIDSSVEDAFTKILVTNISEQEMSEMENVFCIVHDKDDPEIQNDIKRQQEIERQKQLELERQRQQELARQQEIERQLEQQRQQEIARQQEIERQLELQRQQELKEKLKKFLGVETMNPEGIQLWENGPYWSSCNIGALLPYESGYYFWWGDKIGYKREGDCWVVIDGSNNKFIFNSSNCSTYRKDYLWLKNNGYTDSAKNLLPAHDAATAHCGDSWRIPTTTEWDDLKNKCDYKWVQTSNIMGYLVTGRGKFSSSAIFLPFTGYATESNLNDAGIVGDYWSSSIEAQGMAWYLRLNKSGINNYYRDRHFGHTIRPVRTHAQ